MLSIKQGQCLDLLKQVPAQSVDMILCDLPYGTTACKWDAIIPFDQLWPEYNRVCKPNAAMVFTACQPFTTTLIASNIKNYRYDLVWKKSNITGFLNAKKMPMREHESIAVFYRSLPTYNPQKKPRSEAGKKMVRQGVKTKSSAKGEVYGGDVRPHDLSTSDPDYVFPTSVLEFNSERGLHPTQKPVKLMEWLILTYTNGVDTVLDNAMGSGTTGVAAMNLGRSFIGMELDETYFATAEARIQKAVLAPPV